MATEGSARSQSLHHLTRKELDRCLQRVAEELAQAPAAEPEDLPGLRPRWIEAAELIRRVAPFLGRN